MKTFFFGKISNFVQNKNHSEGAVNHVLQNLSHSNVGLQPSGKESYDNTALSSLSALDSFQITKNISELLSPACGMTEDEKNAYFQRILAKLRSGKKLTAEEMRFLQAEHPEFYPQAARVQAMRDGLETRLKCCRSKEAAQTMFANAMDSVSDEDPMKEYLVAAYEDVMKEFKESDAYKELPDTEEEAQKQKKKAPLRLSPAFHLTKESNGHIA